MPGCQQLQVRPLLVGSLLVALVALSGPAQAQATMTTSEILEIARTGVGHAYHWGGGKWSRDGSDTGSCEPKTASNSCPNCTAHGPYGADCSGFVAKAWQLSTPSPVEEQTHPYDTQQFATKETAWTRVPDWSDVRRGDAMVYTREVPSEDGPTKSVGHIRLIDHVAPGSGQFQVMEAEGCLKGITTSVKSNTWRVGAGESGAAGGYTLIRRNNVEYEACSTEGCQFNGECQADATCRCDVGFAGDYCERCADGFAGYPSCTQETCRPSDGVLECGATYGFNILESVNTTEDYGCGLSGLRGVDVSYLFQSKGEGTATITVESPDGLQAIVLRGECDPDTACEDAGESVTFEYGANEQFHIMLDSVRTESGEVLLSVECEPEPIRWIGADCLADSDCDLEGAWRCYSTAPGEEGFCTRACTPGQTYSCPDVPNVATYCVADPAQQDKSLCVAKPSRLNQDCAKVPGTIPQTATRFKDSKEATVCMPSAESCVSGFTGSVTSATTGAPIPAASIQAVAETSAVSVDSGDDGFYGTHSIPCGTYDIVVEAPGYLPAYFTLELYDEGGDVQLVELRAVDDTCLDASGGVHGKVLDGQLGTPMESVGVELHEGFDSTDGPLLNVQGTDEEGNYQFSDVPGGYYTIVATAAGYSTATNRNVSVCGNQLTEQTPMYLVSLASTADTWMTFVLYWDQPNDLDLHLVLPNGQEVFFGECVGALDQAPFATLDIDHGMADGPETITLTRVLPGPYTLFVNNYSATNEGASADWSRTGAYVEVIDWDRQTSVTYNAPAGSGLYWDVLDFNGADVTLNRLNQIRNDRHNVYDEYSQLCAP